ncbi:hypothetical protein [Sphingomonas parapaucimobilis]|uniref:hypothetical protein n=1 Tax=Sphingomonas parapaucimobilis TaxID=28213 RepID=UPI0012ED16D3|nr:hypothetical protein [Sphingomonas parapaucimobilis]
MAKNEAKGAEGGEDIGAECGIIMPIATMPDYPAGHWEAMLELISRGVSKAGMKPQPVWANGPADVIQERIVRNLYEQPYAVCDVSGLNPNVMFELGIRLAFGKPTIIVNDGVIRAPFDIGPAEYVPYDRSLHFQVAEDFVVRLAAKIEAVKSVVQQGNYRPYIKTFGPIELGAPGNESVPLGKAVLDQLSTLAAEMRAVKQSLPNTIRDKLVVSDKQVDLYAPNSEVALSNVFNVLPIAITEVTNRILDRYPEAIVSEFARGMIVVSATGKSPAQRHAMEFAIRKIITDVEGGI